MKRGRVHALFGLVALALAVQAGAQAWQLHRAERINAAIAAQGADDDVPEARFAQAVRLAEAGDTERALKAYKALAQGERDDLKQAALYNLGNLHLREAMQADAARSLPLIELAKQSYRDLLRIEPAHWDARYNLERALWLAPEHEDRAAASAPPPNRERAVTTMQVHGGDLP